MVNPTPRCQPIPVSDRSLGEVIPNVQPKYPLAQLEAIPSCPITSYGGEMVNPQLTTTSLQVVGESNKITSEPPPLQTEQSQLPHLLLIRPVLSFISFVALL